METNVTPSHVDLMHTLCKYILCYINNSLRYCHTIKTWKIPPNPKNSSEFIIT